MLEHLRFNTPLRTTEVLFTDRIHVSRDIGNWDGTDLLIAMLTGHHSPDGMSPYYHVAWEQTPPGFTALVASAGARVFAADLFVHGTENASVVARLFRLNPGRYRIVVSAGGRLVSERTEEISTLPHRLPLTLPGRTAVRIELTAL